MFKAEVIAASRNTFGNRITTMLVTYPRSIHAEMCRHRMLSRNTASSRAIPFKKMLEMIEKTPFMPIAWMKDHSGMQGTEYLTGSELHFAQRAWEVARDNAVYQAKLMSEKYNVTKQIINRLLEPFMWTTELITATEWENFFKLRVDPAAEIHMQHTAELMLTAYNNANITQLKPGEWHIPYETKIDGDDHIINSILNPSNITITEDLYDNVQKVKVKISTAMCAGTSYTIFDDAGKPLNYEKLLKRHDNLITGFHMSPLEHCAQSMTESQALNGYYRGDVNEYGWCKNFRGFIPYRAMIEGENQKDSRVKH